MVCVRWHSHYTIDEFKSQGQVVVDYEKFRKEITDLLLRDFGYSFEKTENRLIKRFGGRPYEELTEVEQRNYDRLKARWEAFDEQGVLGRAAV